MYNNFLIFFASLGLGVCLALSIFIIVDFTIFYEFFTKIKKDDTIWKDGLRITNLESKITYLEMRIKELEGRSK